MVFKNYILLIQQNKYVYSLVILLAFFILSKLVVVVSTRLILKLTKRTKTELDDLIVSRTNKPISLMLLLLGIRLAISPLGIKSNILDIMEHIISSLVILVVTYTVIVIIDIILDNWARKIAERTHSQVEDEVILMFKRISRIFIFIIGLLFILPVWGVQILPVLASLGVAGIAVAFALQSTLSNVFGGASILLDKSVKVGDKIKIDDVTGTVVDVGLRSTKIKTFDNELVTVPNGKLADSKILNFIQPDPSVRVTIDFGVEYGSDIEKVRKVVLDTIKKVPNVLKSPEPKVLMAEMADFSLKFKALFWVNTFDVKFDAKSFATEAIYNALIRAKIGIPFPTRTVYINKK